MAESPTSESLEVAGVDQLDAYIELVEEAGAWLWERGIRQWEPGSNRAQRRLLARLLEAGVLMLARDGERLAGGCILTRTPTPEWQGRPGRALYLHKLAVARFAGGRGLGTRLLEQSEHWTAEQKLERLRLDCWDGNERLRRYYRDAGFREGEAVESFGYQVRLFEKPVASAATLAAAASAASRGA